MGGFPGAAGTVEAAVADEAGRLYIGGSFDAAGNVAANRIARWNGSEWSALGEGMNDWVYALAMAGGNLYAGGRFTTAGGKAAAYLAKTDVSVSLNNGTVDEAQPGWVVGTLSVIDATPGETVFTLVSGPGDDDNASFTIEGDRLKTAEGFDVRRLYSIRIRATHSDESFAEKVFLLRMDGFLVWADALPAEARGETDDPGGYGIPNLLRYAFDMDPVRPDHAALPQPDVSERPLGRSSPALRLTLTYARRADDPNLIFIPEGSDDLDTWAPIDFHVEITDSDGTTETVIITDREPVDTKPKSFLRVRVTRE